MMRKATLAIVVCALLALALFGAMNGGGGTPALAAAPTPVSVTQPVRMAPVLYTLFSGTAITTSAQGTCRELGGWSVGDVQTNIDVSDTQTVTVKIQYSNDGVNLVDGMNLASGSTDASTFVQAPVFGRYSCAYVTLGTSAPVTVNVTGWMK